jgi:hypothetical protein
MISSDIFSRLVNAIHFVIYFATKYELRLNATLLTKIVFFAEVVCFNNLGQRLTSAKIVKGPYGPVPYGHAEAIDQLVKDKKIKIINNYPSISYINIVNPDITLFNVEQLDILKSVIRIFCTEFTATIISDWTQKNMFWQLADMGEEIPIVGFLPNSEAELSPQEIAEIEARTSSCEAPKEWNVQNV